MREIKFRAWDTDDKEMYYPLVLAVVDNASLSLSPLRCCKDGNRAYKPNHPLMQFTGLKDKNGKEIYEGDIVKGVGVTSYDKPIIRIVSFDDASARFGLTDVRGNITFEPLKWTSFPLEIIGNIYENPDLFSERSLKADA